MKKFVTAALSLVILCMPLISLAHPGHGETGGYTIIHYFTEPMHAVFTYSVLLGAVAFIMYSRKSKQHN